MDQLQWLNNTVSPQYDDREVEMEITFMLIKPDGVQRGLIGHIISRIERLGLKLAGMKLVLADAPTVSKHYSKHTKEAYFAGLLHYMTSGPVMAIAWKGPNAIALVRKSITTEGRQTTIGTIRGDFSMHSAHYLKENNKKLPAKNVCHASENLEEASSEIGIWFPELNN